LEGGGEERINGKTLEAFQNKKMESLFLVSCQEVTVFLLSSLCAPLSKVSDSFESWPTQLAQTLLRSAVAKQNPSAEGNNDTTKLINYTLML
jgi:hypothetical protein